MHVNDKQHSFCAIHIRYCWTRVHDFAVTASVKPPCTDKMKQPNWNKTNETSHIMLTCFSIYIQLTTNNGGKQPMADLHCSREIIQHKGKKLHGNLTIKITKSLARAFS